MVSERLERLCDIATGAHQKIQATFKHIDPIVGVNQRMRQSGFAADLMTIDCLKSGKRILIVLHDDDLKTVDYQFTYKDQNPSESFQKLAFSELTEKTLFDWMADYFSA